MVFLIGFVFNNKAYVGGDGNYYLMPMMVIVVVGATATLDPNAAKCEADITSPGPVVFVLVKIQLK